jgi:hypothetical protein
METNTSQTGHRGTAVDGGADANVVTTYLDLDGDGVIDAVQTIEAVAVDVTGDGQADVVEVVEEIAAGIGVDGVPEHVTVVDDGHVALEHTD